MAYLIISGSATAKVNGVYTQVADRDGKPSWEKYIDESETIEVFWFTATNLWYVQGTGVYSTSNQDVDSPELVTNWSNGVSVRLDAAPMHATSTEVGETRKKRLQVIGYI